MQTPVELSGILEGVVEGLEDVDHLLLVVLKVVLLNLNGFHDVLFLKAVCDENLIKEGELEQASETNEANDDWRSQKDLNDVESYGQQAQDHVQRQVSLNHSVLNKIVKALH